MKGMVKSISSFLDVVIVRSAIAICALGGCGTDKLVVSSKGTSHVDKYLANIYYNI